MKNDPRSCDRNFYNCVKKPEKNSGLQRGLKGHGFKPLEVLNFFQASLRNCKNCDHNCEDHSSFEDSVLFGVVTIIFGASRGEIHNVIIAFQLIGHLPKVVTQRNLCLSWLPSVDDRNLYHNTEPCHPES